MSKKPPHLNRAPSDTAKKTAPIRFGVPSRITNSSSCGPYDGAELRPFDGRPGAMAAYSLPSRVGSQLVYRDGRVEKTKE